MSKEIDFSLLESSMKFQELCADLLAAEGFLNVRGLGRGSDQGIDLLIDVPVISPFGTEFKKFIVQCKWYQKNNSVKQSEIGDIIGYLSQHDAEGLLFITSSGFSGTAIAKMEGMNRDTRTYPYRIIYWDHLELSRRINKHPNLYSKFFYATQAHINQVDTAQSPDKNEVLFLLHPSDEGDFYYYTIDRFPKTPGNETIHQSIINFGHKYEYEDWTVIVIEGAIGAGKSGFAWGLLNAKRTQGNKVKDIRFYDFLHLLADFELNQDKLLLTKLGEWKEIDYLLLDDFGMYLTDEDIHVKAFEILKTLVSDRIKLKKPTIIVSVPFGISANVKKFTEYLKARYVSINLGENSLRQYARWEVERTDFQPEGIDSLAACVEPIIFGDGITSVGAEDQSDSAPNGHMGENSGENLEATPAYSTGKILAKDWLLEKLNRLRKETKNTIVYLLEDESDFERTTKIMSIYTGKKITREQLCVDQLKEIQSAVKSYIEYIESINFDCLHIQDDGEIVVIRKGKMK